MAKKQTRDKGKKTAGTAKRATKQAPKGSKGSKTRSTAKRVADPRPKLVKEITALLGKMDEASLNFIKQQASVIVTAGEYEEIRKKTMDALSGLQRGTAEKTAPDAVSVVRKDDSFFNISVRGKAVFFNIDEMRALTKLCHAARNGADGARRLVVWFRRERADFLNETGIAGPADPALPKLWENIVTTYKVKA